MINLNDTNICNKFKRNFYRTYPIFSIFLVHSGLSRIQDPIPWIQDHIWSSCGVEQVFAVRLNKNIRSVDFFGKLFKMTSVGEILNYQKSDREDYYAILGCDESSSVEQINQEYKVRALQCHPDKNAGNKEMEEKFQLLNEAKDTLTNPEKKALYDKWKNSGISMTYKQWLGMKEHVQQSMHWSTPKTKDRMLESGGSSGPSSLGSTNATAAHRRASEGGANLHWGGKGGSAWGTGADAHSEVVSKFRNYEI